MRRLADLLLRVAAGFVLVVSISGPAFAQGSGRPHAFPPGLAEARLIKEMSKEIGVNEETLKKLEELVATIRAEDEALQAKTIEGTDGVLGLLNQSRPDEKELMAAVGAAAGAARKAREHRAMSTLRIRALLDDEQLAKFMDIRKKAVANRRGKPNVRRR